MQHLFTVLGNSQKLFVMIKVLRVSHEDPLLWQRALTPSELSTILANMNPIPAVIADDTMVQALERAATHALPAADPRAPIAIVDRRPIVGSCPICYEQFTENDNQASTVWSITATKAAPPIIKP
ncbi:hypothetical protein SYNPS1DRAFT_23053 [Syncephalis pseudoplumigaleata]|uniref:Uncharacterized protein n=1 Tax=Syncephalis pseudoplumigaleata TaxID=1712513 RepID=A0A4P9YXW3_9FUNG|nr:hypothetical protein SYNPS1DRAFT_23053 [Syncephalis pseudoplumigaleata]|eukprot:RKP24907.1 hypothetical protein SYNPS1DRAFT_23053 [Syncephalis pseudoplumigaleata]